MTYTGRIGNANSSPGNVVPGAGGGDATAAAIASTVAIGSFPVGSVASSLIVATRSANTSTGTAIVQGSFRISAAGATLTVKQALAQTRASTYVGANFTAEASSSALTVATRKETVPTAISVRPADPVCLS